MEALTSAVASGGPLVYVTSPDEDRVVKTVQKISSRSGHRLWMHTVTHGMWDVYEDETGTICQGATNQSLRDPMSLLEYIQEMHIPRNGIIFLLLDFHEWLRDATIRRHLRDLVRPMQESNGIIMILSPVQTMVPELAHEMTCLDFPRPDLAELMRHLEAKGLPAASGDDHQDVLSFQFRQRVASAGRGLTLFQFDQCLARAMNRFAPDDATAVAAAVAEGKKDLISGGGLLEVLEDRPMADLGGLSVLKQWFRKRRHGFSRQGMAAALPTPKGILLFGVPGAGKSLAARAVSGIWELPLLRMDTGRLFVSQVGGSEARVRQAISTVEAAAPCILWIDELDKAMAGLNSSADSDAGTAARVFATIATWMQEKTAPVFILATANSVFALPPELLRKGRWDELFFVDLPGLGDRQEILAIHLRRRGYRPEDFNLRLLAEHSDGCAGAEIEQAITEGLYTAFDENRALATDDVLTALKEQIPLSVTMAEEIADLRQWAAARARPASRDPLAEQRDAWRTGDYRVKRSVTT